MSDDENLMRDLDKLREMALNERVEATVDSVMADLPRMLRAWQRLNDVYNAQCAKISEMAVQRNAAAKSGWSGYYSWIHREKRAQYNWYLTELHEIQNPHSPIPAEWDDEGSGKEPPLITPPV